VEWFCREQTQLKEVSEQLKELRGKSASDEVLRDSLEKTLNERVSKASQMSQQVLMSVVIDCFWADVREI
jgi:hypothetical protein